jgi:hypothetical protein
MAEVLSLGIEQRRELLDFGVRCIDLLSLDVLWTEAAKAGDPAAPEIGGQMIRLIEDLRPRSGEVGELLRATRVELNAYWPHLRDFWRRSAEREIVALDKWLTAEYEGLGDAGVSIAQVLDENLAEEVKLLTAQVVELGGGLEVGGDLTGQQMIWIGVIGVCCLISVAIPYVALAIGANGLVAASFSSTVGLAGIAAGIAGSAYFAAPPPSAKRRHFRLDL